jgi:hypothetical protein
MDPRPHFHWGQASTGMTLGLAFVNKRQKLVIKAKEFLNRVIDDAQLHQRTHLPSIKQMARAAGISHGIMGRAVAFACEQGTLDVRRHRGITLMDYDAGPPPSLEAAPPPRWEVLRRQIASDLCAGPLDSVACCRRALCTKLTGRLGSR